MTLRSATIFAGLAHDVRLDNEPTGYDTALAGDCTMSDQSARDPNVDYETG
jgi:hypothetical protein